MLRKLAATLVFAWTASALFGATIVDFGQRRATVFGTGMTTTRSTNELGPVLGVTSDFGRKHVLMDISQPGGWNLSAFGEISFPVKNPDPEPFELRVNVVSSPPGSTTQVRASFRFLIEGAATTQVRIPLTPPPFAPHLPLSELIGMNHPPYYDNVIYPGLVRMIQPFMLYPDRAYTFQMGNILATGAPVVAPSVPIPPFPFVDAYGQWKHRDWPGKLRSPSEFGTRVASENAELQANPGPQDWDPYGGWVAGPQLGTTGHFRTLKTGGKWYLVDPAGRLFFSMGMIGVHFGTPTPMINREDWFESLPPNTTTFRECYSVVPPQQNYFKGVSSPAVSHNMYALKLRYGTYPKAPFVDVSHRRLRSWGFNTAGTWSSPDIQVARRTPYTAYFESAAPPILSNKIGGTPFRDVFHPDFRANLLRSAANLNAATNDPWCIGIMVDNELYWNLADSIGLATLSSPSNQVAKRVFLTDLQAKYPTVNDLNAVWGTRYASWAALMDSTALPDAVRARADLVAFGEHVANTYFGTIRSVLRSVAPNKLYLGCRFAAWVNTNVARIAGIHCDVVSFNIYGGSPRWEGALMRAVGDKPIMITEFGFGATDRGSFSPGQVPTANQAARAAAMKRYVTDCLKDPNIVGCHWFQYWDQPVMGRPLDGENGGFGFLDVTGTPYPELVGAAREVGRSMYAVRSGGVVPPTTTKNNQTISFAQPAGVRYGTPPITLDPVSSSGLPVTLELVSGPATVAGNVVTVTGAGTVTLRAVQAGSASFNAALPVVRTLTVAKAPLVISADNQRRLAGVANPPLTATFTGFVNGETRAVLDVPVQISTTAVLSSPAGTYPITVSGASDVNYVITFVNGTLTVGSTVSAFQQSSGAEGLVALEVERFDRKIDAGGRSWQAAACPGSSGTALAALPDLGGNFDIGTLTDSPHLAYTVNFVRTGVHYVWVRGLGPDFVADSCHIGLDGVVQSTSDKIDGFTPEVRWSGSTRDLVRATIMVSTPGQHTVNLWMREDGFIADKIVLTTAEGYVPSGFGPPESVRVALP